MILRILLKRDLFYLMNFGIVVRMTGILLNRDWSGIYPNQP